MPDHLEILRFRAEDLECREAASCGPMDPDCAAGAAADVRALLAANFHSPARCLECGDLYTRWRLTNGVCPACADADEAPCTILPCGCYSDACFCGQYPSELDLAPITHTLPPPDPDWTFADLDRAEQLRNRFDLPSDGGRNA